MFVQERLSYKLKALSFLFNPGFNLFIENLLKNMEEEIKYCLIQYVNSSFQ
jgi:hypothetical protein